MTNLERAARALDDLIQAPCTLTCGQMARAVLESLREPSQETIEAMARAICCPSGVCIRERTQRIGDFFTKLPCSAVTYRNEARAAHAALFDRLLGEGKK